MKAIISAVVLTLTLAGCSSVGPVRSVGDDKYTVGSSSNSGFMSWDEVDGMATDRAAAYCKDQGKDLTDVALTTHGARGWTAQEAEVTFKCKAPVIAKP